MPRTRSAPAWLPKTPLAWLRLAFKVGLAAGVGGALLLAGLFVYYGRSLPDIRTLEDYSPPQVSRVFSADGEEVGEFFIERRTVLPFDEIPEVMVQAILSAEDDAFYEHEGVDYLGIFRAAVKNTLAGGVKQGASTITQQVVKTFLLTPERTYARKIKELILARRIEANLSKDEILYLYLNQIYFGHGRYGIEEASRYYFGKSARELDLMEATLLAGIPKSPAGYSPRRRPERARKRQRYVLRRMVELGHISAAQRAEIEAAPLRLAPPPAPSVGAVYVEEARRFLVGALGEERLLEGGLSVRLGMNATLQRAAEEAVRLGLHAVDQRHGWRGPAGEISPEALAPLREALGAALERGPQRGLPEALVWDLSPLAAPEDDEAPAALKTQPLTQDALVVGVVERVEGRGRWADVDLGSVSARVALSGARWAWPQEKKGRRLERLDHILKPGQLVRVRLGDVPLSLRQAVEGGLPSPRPRVQAALAPRPEVEGALVSIDPLTRQVRALVGGLDAQSGDFNRATQAKRQPGSSFKPFVYGAALASGEYTLISKVIDGPEVFRDPWTGKTWKPTNSDGGYDGEISLRQAIARSKNLVAVRLIDRIGVEAVLDFAKAAGVQSELPRFLPLALGAGEVSPLEMVNAYTTIAAGGTLADPVLVVEVRDRQGGLLLGQEANPREGIDPAAAFVLAELMRAVLEEGTGKHLNTLGRPTAGKTGTTSDQKDAWFIGFVPELVTGVWVGYDAPRSLGRGEYGGRAAGPIWRMFMEGALTQIEPVEPTPPPSVSFVRVAPESGLLARPGEPGTFEPFVPGTEPTELAPLPGAVSAGDFFLVDTEEL